MTVLLPVLRDKTLKSWPKHESGGRVKYTGLPELLTKSHPSDAHFACYSLPAVERRLCVEIVRDPEHADKIPDGISMVAAVFDIDCELSHKSSGAKAQIPAPDEWWLAELPKVAKLRDGHPGAFVYRTKGGYRLVFELGAPFVIRTAADDEAWTTTYVRWVAYLQRAFGIYADPSCAEWVRLFRAPHATRDGNARPENRETIGDPNAVGTWTCEPSAEDIALALTLKKQKPPKKTKALRPAVESACDGAGVLFFAFQARGEIGKELEPGKWAVRCPNEANHSKGETFDTSTVLWAPRREEGETLGYLHCSHGHCQTQTLADVVGCFSADEIKAARVAAGLPPEETKAPKPVLLLNDSGTPKRLVANVLAVLGSAPECRDLLGYDEFRETIVVLREPPCRETERPTKRDDDEWTEEDSTRFAAWLATSFELDATAMQVEEAVRTVARKAVFYPVRDWLESLKWDGVERLPSWLSTYCKAAETAYTRAIGTRWLISAVARAFEPGCQVDCTLILEGDQGRGKSSAVRALVPESAWYSETGITIGDKDSYQALRGKWIYLFDELDSLKRSEVTKVKTYLSAPKDHYRASYGRRARDYLRQNVFVGTTNQEFYLVDVTGNRRFWPVRTLGVLDVEGIRRDRDQLWAEALVRYLRGEKWHVDTPELRKLCEAEQAKRVQPDDWAPIVARWLADPDHEVEDVNEHGRTVRRRAPFTLSEHGPSTAEVLEHALRRPPAQITRADSMRAGEVLRSLGYGEAVERMADGGRARRYPFPPQPGCEKNGGCGGQVAEPAAGKTGPLMSIPQPPQPVH